MALSKTETAIAAIVSALTTSAAAGGSVITAPARNEILPKRLADAGSKLEIYLNVWDGDTEIQDEVLGADLSVNGFDLVHTFTIEWVVAGGLTDSAREQRFDLGIQEIVAATRGASGLAGVIERVTVTGVRSAQKDLAERGIPNAKGCEILVRLEFMSSDIR